MSTVLSTNMNLPVPVVGQEPGPDYATDINNCMNILDAHTHTAGSGVQITPSALNINSTLAFNNNFANTVAGVTYSPQSSTPATGTTYVNGADLYYIDTIGNIVRITQSGAVAGTPGSIANLVPPASATYVSGSQTFVWQSNTNIAANLDAGSLLMRNLSPNSTFALTLQPPAALSNNYSITLPTLPSSQKIMTLDNAGLMAAPYTVDGVTIVITSNVIKVGSINGATNIDSGTITTTQISPTANITGSQLSSSAGIVGGQIAQNTITGAVTVNGTTGNLALGTVSINNMGAVNYVASADSALFTTGATGYTNVTNLANAITTHGRMVKVFLTFPAVPLGGTVGIQTDGTASMRILRDAVTTVVDFEITGNSFQPQMFYDVPPAGGHSYIVQTKQSGGSFVSWTSVVLVCVED